MRKLENDNRVIRRLFLKVTSDENVWIDFIKLSKNIFTVQASSRCHVAEVAKKIFSVTIVGRCSSNYEMKEPLYRDLFIEKNRRFLKNLTGKGQHHFKCLESGRFAGRPSLYSEVDQMSTRDSWGGGAWWFKVNCLLFDSAALRQLTL